MNSEILHPQPIKHTPTAIVKRYLELGFKLVFWSSDGKEPKDANWPTLSQEGHYTLEEFHEGMNVGALLGTEIQPKHYLVDIDFDWPCQHELAAILLIAKNVLKFGRSSKRPSHLFYTTSTPIVTKAYRDPFKKERLDPTNSDFTTEQIGLSFAKTNMKIPANIIELRGTKVNGTLGNQTVVPPSIHPSGERIELDNPLNLWADDPPGNIGHDEEGFIPIRVSMYAAAYLLYSHFKDGKFNHFERMAAAGFFMSCGLEDKNVYLMVDALAFACKNDRKDAKNSVDSTIDKKKNKKPVTGRRDLASYIGKQGNRVLVEIAKLLGGSLFDINAKAQINAQSQENIRIALDLMEISLSYNEFSQQYMVSQSGGPLEPLQDPHLNHIWLEMDLIYHFRPSKDLFQTVALDVAWQNKFHPVLDYYNSISWDGVTRLDTWLTDCAGAADNEYTRAIAAMIFIASVRRMKHPGTKFDELPILEGEQGVQKSSALKIIAIKEEWFCDNLPLDADPKTMMEQTQGKVLIEIPDLIGFRTSKIEQLKASLSRTHDVARMAYGRMPSNVPRQWVGIATTNAHIYLKDSTGNRRFWPIRVQQFDLELLGSIRDQLWAEAVAREATGESIRLSPHLYKFAEFEQERRREEDPWEEVLKDHFLKTRRFRITINDLWDVVQIPVERRTKPDQERLSAIMVRAGFTRSSVRTKGANAKASEKARPMKGWICKDREKLKNWLKLNKTELIDQYDLKSSSDLSHLDTDEEFDRKLNEELDKGSK